MTVPRRRLIRVLTLTAVLGLGAATTRAMPSAPAGVLETGAPLFVVLGPEALGLSTAPINLHVLPDGRVLVVSQLELAFGDGVRWETFRALEGQPPIFASVAVGRDGQIYTGTDGGIARIELLEGARWRLTRAVDLPPEAASQNATLVSVADLSDRWYWYGGNGAIVSWRPGQQASVVGNMGAIERIFALGKEVYVSDQNMGGLFHLLPGGGAEPVQAADLLMSESVTCAIPFGPDQLLVGTASAGMKLFDGKKFIPFGPSGVLNEGHRISDLCAVGQGVFAVSIDTEGIVFFDRAGNTVQELDRFLDHRLARVQRLQYAPNGVLWGLLNDGVVRVEFPSPVSHFEPLLASGLTYAQPLRHAGQLWVVTDGRVMRGIYEASGRLDRFEDDTPPGRFLFTLTDVDGELFGCNEAGIFVFEPAGWRLILPGIVNARIGVARSTKEGWFYVARGEYGMIQKVNGKYTARRIPAPGLGDSYGSEVDFAGTGWLELGASSIGRLDPNGGNPQLQILGSADGLASGWVELYLVDGIARFHVAKHVYRFDDTRRKFREDLELLARFPQLAAAGGRPVTDSFGRFWYTANGAIHVVDRSAAGGNRPVMITPLGFVPTTYTPEDDGVVWMFEKRRLARMDLRLPPPPPNPLRALITSVEFPASKRHLFTPDEAFAPLSYADNSVIVHFAVPANPFASPVTFEVLLEGAGTQWISTGPVGSATFNGLEEGDYVFRVRPVAGGTVSGEEDRLQFTVRPPRYRTPLAWVIYVLAAVALLVFVTWFSSFLQSRKNQRLELLVAERTVELNATNTHLGRQIQETTEKSAALSASEERFRTLNTELESRVQERTLKLVEASSLLEAMLDSSPDQIYFKDLQSRFLRTSRAQTANFGLQNIEEIVGKTDRDFFSEEHARAALEDEQQIIHTGRPIIGKIEKETWQDGRGMSWVLTTKMPWRDGTGAIIGTFGISKNVTEWKEAEAKLADTHRQLLDSSRMAGMAEVATGVLHNVGNVLNSVNVSATLVADQVRRSKSANLRKVCDMLDQHRGDLAAFLTVDPKGAMIPPYLTTLADSLAGERKLMIAELDNLRKNIEHIKDIVTMQQSYAKASGFIETVSVPDLVEDAIRINSGSLARHDIDTVREYVARPVVTLDKHKVMQILINLVRNAKYACDESGRPDKRITVRITADERRVRVAVIDNGVGIPPENLTRIFSHGFTTRKHGHGFGLHSGALAARELGGALLVQSDGPGQGATFVLELPYKPETISHEKPVV